MGVLADKDYGKILDLITPFAEEFVCVTPDSPRAMPAQKLAELLTGRGFAATVCGGIEEGVRVSLQKAQDARDSQEAKARPVVAFGSLYMAGAIRTAFRRQRTVPCLQK